MRSDTLIATPSSSISDLRSEPDLLRRFDHDVEQAGLVGEKKNARIILLAAVSAKLQKPLNVSVGGASAAGKNHLIGTVARFIPPEGKRVLSGMSPKALMHAREDEFQHKAVFIAEYEGVSGADYPIRTMQSEQVIEYDFVDPSDKHGLGKKTNTVKGPAAFIQATTRATLHPENETRLLFVQLDESAAQTRAIKEQQALQAEGRAISCSPDIFKDWHQLIRNLGGKDVRIPWASQLARSLPDERIRSRRDFPKLLGLIEASAFLHQYHRPRDEQGNIIALPQDYMIASELFTHCYYAGPESKVGELVGAAKELGKEEFTVTDLMRETGWGKSKVYAVLNRAEELGNIGEGDKRGSYRLLHNQVESPLNLPAKIRLSAGDFRISTATHPENFRNSDFPRQEVGYSLSGKVENQTMRAST
jgi:hypothetical protein